MGDNILTIGQDALHCILQGLPWSTILAARLVCRAMCHRVDSMGYDGAMKMYYRDGGHRVEVTYTIGPTVTQVVLNSVIVTYGTLSTRINQCIDTKTIGQYDVVKIHCEQRYNTIRYLYIKDRKMKHMIDVYGTCVINVVSSNTSMNPWKFLANYHDKVVGWPGSVLHYNNMLTGIMAMMGALHDPYSPQLLSLMD